MVMLVLLLTVPFQAALGATGMLCANNAHHSMDADGATHAHDAAASSDHHHDAHGHDAPASAVGQDSSADPGSHAAQGASGKCKVCNECCSAAAPVPAAMHSALPPDTPLRVSSTVDAGKVSRTVDGLFRPPRTTSV